MENAGDNKLVENNSLEFSHKTTNFENGLLSGTLS